CRGHVQHRGAPSRRILHTDESPVGPASRPADVSNFALALPARIGSGLSDRVSLAVGADRRSSGKPWNRSDARLDPARAGTQRLRSLLPLSDTVLVLGQRSRAPCNVRSRRDERSRTCTWRALLAGGCAELGALPVFLSRGRVLAQLSMGRSSPGNGVS